MSEPTLYELLGLQKDCTAADVKRAYKQKALQLHPDKNPDGEELFKRVAEAFEILCDPRRRQDYDAKLTEVRVSSVWGVNPEHFRPRQKTAADYEAERKRREKDDLKRKQEKEFATGGQNFADWYKTKLEQHTSEAEEAAERIAEAERQRLEEERRAADERAAAKRRQDEEITRLEALRAAAREQQLQAAEETERLERERQEAAFRDRESEWSAKKEERERAAEKANADLRNRRASLREEQRRMADERKELAEFDLDATRTRREQAQEALKKQQEEETARVRAAKRAAAEHEQHLKEERERMRLAAEQERLESARRMQALKEEEVRWQKEEQSARQEQQQRARQAAARGRSFMKEAQDARLQHEKELAEMRRETDRIEQEMLAKLEAVRRAKREGRPLDLSSIQLTSSNRNGIDAIDGWVGADVSRAARKCGSEDGDSMAAQTPHSPPLSRPAGSAGSLLSSFGRSPSRPGTGFTGAARPSSADAAAFGFREKSPPSQAEIAARVRATRSRQGSSSGKSPSSSRPAKPPLQQELELGSDAESDSSDDALSGADAAAVARCAEELLKARHGTHERPASAPAPSAPTSRPASAPTAAAAPTPPAPAPTHSAAAAAAPMPAGPKTPSTPAEPMPSRPAAQSAAGRAAASPVPAAPPKFGGSNASLPDASPSASPMSASANAHPPPAASPAPSPGAPPSSSATWISPQRARRCDAAAGVSETSNGLTPASIARVAFHIGLANKATAGPQDAEPADACGSADAAPAKHGRRSPQKTDDTASAPASSPDSPIGDGRHRWNGKSEDVDHPTPPPPQDAGAAPRRKPPSLAPAQVAMRSAPTGGADVGASR
eukprot:TRINITY_DN13583_c0_g1_i1.p1 TRINITY_DN13583_c0_g1~~TRINITY_DN13583_c0_g1_i1.p1  ORF type:complete len:857 (+),score=244.67 TRINITY_DN13583_c0_g1_i1:45-2573(+)